MLPQSLSAKTSVANAAPFRAPLAQVQKSRGNLQVCLIKLMTQIRFSCASSVVLTT